MDNWPERERVKEKAGQLGLDITELFILSPDRLKNDKDGPCHSPEQRLLFWKDVLVSLEISYETLFSEARKLNNERRINEPEHYISDLENKILQLR